MTIVKICGITNVHDATMATDLGADLLGFNFFPGSPRFISAEKAKEIVGEIGSRSETVGVFVNEKVDLILKIADESNVDTIQLHGDETNAYIKEIRKRCGRSVIKAWRPTGEFDRGIFDGSDADAILIDSYSPHLYGGTGEVSNWKAAGKAAAIFPKVFLAGGLNPENVGAAIETVRPYAVDAASGVEAEKGRKDMKKLRDFIRIAKET